MENGRKSTNTKCRKKYEGSAVVMTSMQKVEEGAESHGNVMKGLWAEECNGEEEEEGSAEGGREGKAEKRGHLFPGSTKRNELVARDVRGRENAGSEWRNNRKSNEG